MEELKAMVNEIVHFVRYSSAKTITVETPEEKDGEDGKGRKENGEKIAVVLKCPKCGQGEIVKGKTAWGCTLYRKSCDFLIPMEIQGKKLTQKQVDTLIQKAKPAKYPVSRIRKATRLMGWSAWMKIKTLQSTRYNTTKNVYTLFVTTIYY